MSKGKPSQQIYATNHNKTMGKTSSAMVGSLDKMQGSKIWTDRRTARLYII